MIKDTMPISVVYNYTNCDYHRGEYGLVWRCCNIGESSL